MTWKNGRGKKGVKEDEERREQPGKGRRRMMIDRMIRMKVKKAGLEKKAEAGVPFSRPWPRGLPRAHQKSFVV